jgi:nicotinic acid mononucleotide adenylyltransferase
MSTAVISFGRLNPPTSGHQLLVNKMLDVARANKALPFLYLSHSQDKKKNPLSYDQKVAFAKRAFGNVVRKSKARTIIEVLKELDSKFNDIIVVVGSDRVNEFNTLLTRYNGKEYTYESITIVSAGQRDPDADDVSGMSASKLRALAAAGDFEQFKTGMPTKFNDKDAMKMYEAIRNGMSIKEDIEINEVLNIQQRLKRKMIMRRIRAKLKRGARIARKRMAKPEKLKVRAARKARQALRVRLAGKLGANYAKLSSSAKMQIDKKLVKRKSMIAKLAKRMLPKVRKAEMQRLKLARAPKKEDVEYIMQVNTLLENLEKKSICEKIEANLIKKSEKYGVDVEELKEKYIAYKVALESDQLVFEQINSELQNISDEVLEEGVVDALKSVDPKLGRLVDRTVNKDAYKKAIRFYLDYRKKYPGQAQQNLVKASKITGADYKNLEYILNDMIQKGKLPAHLSLDNKKVRAVQEESEGKKLNKPFRTPDGPKKFAVYVKNEKGNTVKVTFGDPNMEIKRDDPARRKSFRARHGCDNPGPKTKAKYWSCRQWRAGAKVEG